MRDGMTTHEKIRNAAACQQVENLHARHCYLHCAGRNVEEVDNYWIDSDKVSWGHAFGKWTGWQGVKFGWGSSLERQGYGAYLELTQVWPQVTGLDPRPLYEAAMHTLATDIIEVAEDGQTARAYFYTPGAISSTLNTDRKREGMWMWERYGIEYAVDEDGDWKLFTIQVCPDLMLPMDSSNPAADSLISIRRHDAPPEFGRGGNQVLGCGGPIAPIVDEQEPVHAPWSLVQTVQDPVPWPEPYTTYHYNRSYRYRVKDWEEE
jgi:hypothetical protein